MHEHHAVIIEQDSSRVECEMQVLILGGETRDTEL
jgi:hypothetical protein